VKTFRTLRLFFWLGGEGERWKIWVFFKKGGGGCFTGGDGVVRWLGGGREVEDGRWRVWMMKDGGSEREGGRLRMGD